MGSNPILHLRSAGARAGPDSVLLDLLPALDRLGRRCDAGVICHQRHPDGDLLDALTRRGIRALRLPSRGPVDPRLWLALVRRGRGYRAIHAHDPKSHVYGAAAAAATGLPLVVTHHGWLSRDGRERVYERIDAAVMRRARQVICVSQGARDTLHREHDVPLDRITHIPNGVDPGRLLPGDRGVVCCTLGIDPRRPIVVAVGRLDRSKGFDLLLRALGSLDRPVSAVILGDGPLRGELQRLAAQRSLDVILPGHRPDAVEIMGAADLFALPSLSEQHPVALLEAMGLGLPLVAANVGDVAETVGEGGAVVPPGDAVALADALRRLLDDQELGAKMGVIARQRVAAHYSAERMAEAHARVYSELLSGTLNSELWPPPVHRQQLGTPTRRSRRSRCAACRRWPAACGRAPTPADP